MDLVSVAITFLIALVAAWAFVTAHYKLDFVAQLTGR